MGDTDVGDVWLDIPARKCKVVEISDNLLLSLLQSMDGTQCLKVEGMPADAKVAGVWPDGGEVLLLIESDDFEPVENGKRWPRLDLFIKTVKPSWLERPPLL